MAVEHVEDVLIDRRVVIEDEEWQTYQVLIQEGLAYDPEDLENLDLADQDLIAPRLRKISQINRYRRNHHLLKDWSKKRPWNQLYYVFDTSDNGQYTHCRPLIDSWYQYHQILERIPQFMEPDSPSKVANIWSGFFLMHPIASHSLTAPDKPQPTLPLYDEGCIICMENFIAQETVVELHCKHLFHYTCIRKSWDNDRRYKMDCPLCRKNWRLDEVAGIKPEVLDVWDNERVLIAHEASAHPDIGELYGMTEGAQVELSLNWGADDPEGLQTRDAAIELAHLRRKRLRRNEERRERYHRAGQGMQSYFLHDFRL
jgi:hypothetical protein